MCFEVYHNPLLLPGCGHTLCQACAEELITEENFLRCPECRLVYQLRQGIKSLPKNVALQRTIDEHTQNSSRYGVRISTNTTHYNCIGGLHPSKHDTSIQCWTNAGPPSTTLAQHYSSIGSMCRVCWGIIMYEYEHGILFLMLFGVCSIRVRLSRVLCENPHQNRTSMILPCL